MNPQYNFPPFLIIAKQQMNLNLVSVRLIITTCFICLIMPYSNGSDNSTTELYNICSSVLYSCGHIKNLGYPFWGGNRPEICGQKEFKLSCNWSNTSHIVIDSTNPSKVPVTNITPSSHTLLAQTRSTCPKTVNNQKLAVTSPFKLSASVGNLTLFSDCSTRVFKYQRCRNISCSPFDLNATHVYSYCNFHKSQAYNTGNLSKSCKATVAVPVMKTALDELNHGNGTLESVFDKGFEVEYSVTNANECLKCQNKGGTCGSSGMPSWEFICYHSEGIRNSARILRSAKRNLGPILASGICILIIIVGCFRKRIIKYLKSKATMNDPNLEAYLRMHGSHVPQRYNYASIRNMTNSFSDKIGEGGHAIVYKGKFSNGRLAAVKLLKQSKSNGEEFINEVVSMGRTNHVNIVTLLGFCFEGNKRALVYEFMPNGSLEKFTINNNNDQSLPLDILFNITVGIARGLEYLHRGCNTRILHFDIKPHNILLDEKMCPKISDFGLARLCPLKESTISMLEARGTIGYIAPEVFCRNFGGISHKSDVYSYGMMVLDMVCGRANICGGDEHSGQSNFSHMIYNRIELGEDIAVALHGIMSDEEKELQRKMILVSLWCIQTYPSNRPPISKVVEMLEGCLESIQIPPKPFLRSPPRSAFDSFSSFTIGL